MTEHLDSLLHRIARGDSNAMLRFYDSTAARVFGVIGTRIVDPVQRELTLERIYLEVWATADTFDAEASSACAWLITLTHRMTAGPDTAAPAA